MGKLDKFLKKLSKKKQEEVGGFVVDIINNHFDGLDGKKLKGVRDVFRVRKGGIRIIFKKTEKDILIISIERRSDNTYS
jgi:mRNA-degrading endonuclease RelE of RelBE toxin-antitoxin system